MCYNILVVAEVTFSTSDLYVVSNFLNTLTVGSNFITYTQNNLQGHGCDISKKCVCRMKTDPLENIRFVIRLILKYTFPLNMADKFAICQKRKTFLSYILH